MKEEWHFRLSSVCKAKRYVSKIEHRRLLERLNAVSSHCPLHYVVVKRRSVGIISLIA